MKRPKQPRDRPWLRRKAPGRGWWLAMEGQMSRKKPILFCVEWLLCRAVLNERLRLWAWRLLFGRGALEAVAYHEAGHVLAAFWTGRSVTRDKCVSIVPQWDKVGGSVTLGRAAVGWDLDGYVSHGFTWLDDGEWDAHAAYGRWRFEGDEALMAGLRADSRKSALIKCAGPEAERFFQSDRYSRDACFHDLDDAALDLGFLFPANLSHERWRELRRAKQLARGFVHTPEVRDDIERIAKALLASPTGSLTGQEVVEISDIAAEAEGEYLDTDSIW